MAGVNERTQVLFVTGANPMRGGGGLESYVRAHALAADAAGFDVHVFCLGRGARVSREAFGYVHQTAIPPHTIRSALAGLYSPLLARALNRHVRHAEPVLIHAFGAHSVGAARFCRAHEGRGLRSVLVTSAFTTEAQETGALLAGLRREHGAVNALHYLARYGIVLAIGTRNERRGYAASRLLLVNYESVRTLLREQFRADWEIREMPYASDTAFSSFAEADHGPAPDPIATLEPRTAPLIVCVSRHDARKGVDVLLEALGAMQASGVSFRACLLGRGELIDAHRRLAERLGLGRSVVITGKVPDVVPYLVRADVYVLPSLSEASGSVSLLEAMQAGAAIVTSGCDGIPEDVVDGESAIVVAPGDVTALAGAISTLLGDAGLRRRLGARAREVYEERFSAEPFVDALSGLYGELGFTPGPAR
jgi:glycosyltransferase involved in cell wall biosynthesis